MNTRLVDCCMEMSVVYRQSGTAAYFCMQCEQFSSNYVVQCQMLMQTDWQRHSNATIYVIPVLSTSCTVTSLWHCRRHLTSRVFIVRASSKRLATVGFSWHPWTWSWERVVRNVVTWFNKLLSRTAVRPTERCSEHETGTFSYCDVGCDLQTLRDYLYVCLCLTHFLCLKFLNCLFKTPVKIYYDPVARCCTS